MIMPVKPTYEELERRIRELESADFARKQAEAALLKCERELRAIVRNITDALYVHDFEGRLLDCNEAACRMTGYSREELVGHTLAKLESRDSDLMSEYMKRLMHDDHILFEDTHVRKDGSLLPVEIRAKVVSRDGNGVIHRFVRDITDRKLAEEGLRETNRLLEGILDGIPDIIGIQNPDHTIVRYNKAGYEALGMTHKEVAGRPCFSLLGRTTICANCATLLALKSKKLQTVEQFVPELGRHLLCRSNPILDDTGEVHLIIEQLQDITELKRAEKALMESYAKNQEEQNFNRLLLDTSPAFIVAIGMDGKTIMMNKALLEAVEYTSEEIKNTDYLTTFVSEEDREAVAKVFQEIMYEGKGTKSLNRIISRSGKTFLVEWHGRTVGGEGANSDVFVGVGIDITERKQMEEEREKLAAQLLQSQKRESIGVLAGGIAHDFNNILSAIIGFAEIAGIDLPEGSRNAEYLAKALKATDRAKDLVKQILTFSRQSETEVRPLRLEPTVMDALRMLRSSIPTSIEIHQSADPDLPAVMADPTHVYQIVMNLCTNAAHAIEDEHGVIEIALDEFRVNSRGSSQTGELSPGRYVRVKISDTGTGMPPDVQERIFDPYFTTKKVGEGTGLGLSVVYGIVKEYRGGIYVESELGKGTSFTVLLPVAEDLEYPETTATRQALLPFGREHILFVDDEPMIIDLGKTNLERLGYKVTTRQSSMEALELFRNNPQRFDLVVTDMTMPHLTGDELAKKMLLIRPDLPIILCTGYSKRISEKKAKTMGIRAFVMKPLSQYELANTVRQVLDEGPLKQRR